MGLSVRLLAPAVALSGVLVAGRPLAAQVQAIRPSAVLTPIQARAGEAAQWSSASAQAATWQAAIPFALIARPACQANGSGRDAITEVQLFAARDRATLTVRMDGTATYLVNRKDRRRRVGLYAGRVPAIAVGKVIALLQNTRCSARTERFDRPYPRDSDTFSLRVVRGAASVDILADDTAPAGLRAVRDTLLSLASRASWTRAKSGIRGVLVGPSFVSEDALTCKAARLASTLLVVRDPRSDAAIVVVDTDANGRFDVPLPPGTYMLQANVYRPGPKSGEGVPMRVTIRNGRRTGLVLHYAPIRP